MKKRTFVMTSLLLLSLMVAAQVVQAQELVVVNIPFEFVAGNATLPAGEYRVEKLEKNSVVVLTHCAQPGASAIARRVSHSDDHRIASECAAIEFETGLQSLWKSLFSFAVLDGRKFEWPAAPEISERRGDFQNSKE